MFEYIIALGVIVLIVIAYKIGFSNGQDSIFEDDFDSIFDNYENENNDFINDCDCVFCKEEREEDKPIEVVESTKFKVGDKVKYISEGFIGSLDIGDVVTVKSVDTDGNITSTNKSDLVWCHYNAWFQLVEKPKTKKVAKKKVAKKTTKKVSKKSK